MPKKKTTSAKKKSAKKVANKATKKTVKKSVAKATKKTANKAPKKAAKKKLVKKSPVKETVSSKAKAPNTTKVASSAPKSTVKETKAPPIVFSLDDVEELMASKKSEAKSTKPAPKKKPLPVVPKKVIIEDKPVEQRILGAASLADILGFNPAEKKKSTDLSSEQVPKKWKKYYNLLVELRGHVRDELNLHTADTLKHSSRDDSGDLSNYGSHQADAGTDTFDRDFALSLVSSEQEALNEIEEAILRIKNGTYGICEVTGKAIPAARLTAVPFARYSVDGQAEYEKNLRRKVDRSGNTSLFGDVSDVPKLASNDEDE